MDIGNFTCNIKHHYIDSLSLNHAQRLAMEMRSWKPNVEISPSCPRCGSSNTKFCYYNNYSLTQPRYFCKGCRRYWTKGGSLRNVPVGGGCRKNRRGKSLRLSTTDGVSSRGCASSDHGRRDGSTSMMHDGPNIDLALVYANYLNQRPDSKAGFQTPELPGDFDPSFEFLSISDPSTVQLAPLENGVVQCSELSDGSAEKHFCNGNLMYLCDFGSIRKQEERVQHFTNDDSCRLPPLPGEDVGPQKILWSNSQMMVSNPALEATAQQLPGVGPEAQDPNLLTGYWSSVDLSSYETFFRP